MRLCLSKVGEAVGHRFAVLVLTVFLESVAHVVRQYLSYWQQGKKKDQKKRTGVLWS